MKQILLLFGIGLFSFNLSLGQNSASADQKMLPNNDGSGLNGSMGNMLSPSLFDGSMTIGIPIFQYGNFGISISYNTKGVTLDELSGPIGTHWNLRAGGSIIRVVKDFPDDYNMPYTGNSSTNNYYSAVGRQFQYSLTSQPSNQYWDVENDEYLVSAGSLNFSFKMGKNGYFLTYPINRCKITPVIYNGYGVLGYESFAINDEQGNKYYFGRGESTNGTFNTGNPNISQGLYNYISKWDLDSIILADGKKITYDYESFAYPGTIALYRPRTQKNNTAQSATPVTNAIVEQSDVSSYGFNLTAIHYPGNVTAAFVYDQVSTDPYDECQKTIKQIEISQGTDNCKKYRFNKVYLTQDPNNPNLSTEVPFNNECNFNDFNTRLTLKSIDVLSCDELTKENYYSFEYSPTAAPNRFGNNRDFFGYCNILTTSVNDLNNYFNEIPTHRQAFSTQYGADPSNKANSSNANIVAALCLTKVKNAYGGALSFQYEVHTGLANEISGLPDPGSDHLFMGLNAVDGLRLHATISSDKYHPGADLTTTYTYSGGQLFLNGGYFSYPTSTDANGVINEYMNTNSWISSHQLINGSNHGYSQVTVTNTDFNGNILSSTKNYFSNFNDNGIPRQLIIGSTVKRNYFQLPFSDKQYIKDWEIGLPIKTEEFDQFGNILSRTINYYSSHIDTTSSIAGLGKNIHTLRVAPPDPPASANILTLRIIASDTFVPYSGISLLDSSFTQKFINSSISINDTVRYKYDTKNNVSYVLTRNSKGEYFRLQYIYNYNISGSSVLTSMTNDGLEIKVGMERWKQTSIVPSSNDLLMDASITKYLYQNNKIWTHKLYNLRSLQPIPFNTYTSSNTNPYGNIINSYNNGSQSLPNFILTREVLQFDSKGNPLETQSFGQDVYEAMMYDSLTGLKTVDVSNARLQDIGFTSFEITLPNASYTGQETLTDGGFSFKEGGLKLGTSDFISGQNTYKLTTVNVNTAGITSPLLRANQKYIITFWAKGGHPVLSGTIGTVNLISTVSVNGWTFYQGRITPPTNGTLSFSCDTYTTYFDELRLFPENSLMENTIYAPMVGKTSETNERGSITYYQYDVMGRQTIVKDQNNNILVKKVSHIGH